jgi:tetratricopeptide (TPR) repeat protein
MRALFLAAAMTVTAIGLSLPAQAAGGGSMESSPAKPVDANFTRAKAMIQVVTKDPKNADAYNLMGFATRKSGNPNGSLQYYQQALAIDSRHIGAYEYLGEAYLMLGRLPEAEQQLARLDSLCTFGCAEYRQLKAAIADYKAGKRPATN